MSINARLRVAVLARDGYACIYCGRRPPEVMLEVDHVLPRAAGGTDIDTNLVTVCRDCNGGKSDQPMPLPPGYRPEPIGFQQRRVDRLHTADDIPHDLRWVVDGCPQCPQTDAHAPKGCANAMPLTFIDGDALSFQLGYKCACGHQWHCWWYPELARTHAFNTKQLAKQGRLIHYPLVPRWLS